VDGIAPERAGSEPVPGRRGNDPFGEARVAGQPIGILGHRGHQPDRPRLGHHRAIPQPTDLRREDRLPPLDTGDQGRSLEMSRSSMATAQAVAWPEQR